MGDITAETHSRGWSSLPTELKDMILDHCTGRTHSEANQPAASPQLALLATVCRDWDHFFGAKVFQRLTLKTEADVQNFAKIVQGRRRAYLEWIWLRIELPMYTCEQCHRTDTREEVHAQRALYTNLVWNLFDVLSKWKTTEARRDGITLEMSANSPSDAHHFNKDLRFRLHDTAWDRWDDRPIPPHNDPFHGWKDGKHIKAIPQHAKYRLFGPGLRFDYKLSCVRRLRMRLPKVSVVTSFVIRRQFPRVFGYRSSLAIIMRSLTRLKNFCCEPWRGPSPPYQREQASSFSSLVKYGMKARRQTLKKLSIFESHDDIFYRAPRSRDVPRYPYLQARFSDRLARASHQLEELYVAKIIDAGIFFGPFHPKAPPSQKKFMVWKSLRRLSLTTVMLCPALGDTIIKMAALAAKEMPQLQIMELWNYRSDKGMVCIFRFRREQTQASVELVSTVDAGVRVPAATKAAWGRVATAHRPLPFTWRESTLNAGEVDGEHSVLSKLHLVGHMLNPISLRQIAREDQRRREERDA